MFFEKVGTVGKDSIRVHVPARTSFIPSMPPQRSREVRHTATRMLVQSNGEIHVFIPPESFIKSADCLKCRFAHKHTNQPHQVTIPQKGSNLIIARHRKGDGRDFVQNPILRIDFIATRMDAGRGWLHGLE